MNDTIHVKGLSALNTYLDAFEPKLRKNIMRGALRAGVKTILPVAQQNIHSISGELAKGLKLGTRAKGTQVKAYVKATGKHRTIAHLIEYGTKAHIIVAKDGGALMFGGGFHKSVQHPGIAPYGDKSVIGPHAFARPALDQQATEAVVATGNYIANRLRVKHGLDAQDIQEGDE